MVFDIQCAKEWICLVNARIQQEKHYLSELDRAIGDGDHGINMARGFQAVLEKVNDNEYKDLGSLFKDAGFTLLSKVGGASGPLLGTAFIKASSYLVDKESVSVKELTTALSASLDGLKSRGRAQVGDKTMIDVWEPVVFFMKANGEKLIPAELGNLAIEMMENTKVLEAKKGRAAYLGKRSVGHIDPGATSSAYLFEALATVLKGEENNGNC